MDIETLREICKGLPSVTEDIKWGADLCFLIGEKMFCVAGMDNPLKVSLKVADEEFGEMSNRPGIIPAPYLARYRWILIEDLNVLNRKEWEHYIMQSYMMVKEKLPKKVLAGLK